MKTFRTVDGGKVLVSAYGGATAILNVVRSPRVHLWIELHIEEWSRTDGIYHTNPHDMEEILQRMIHAGVLLPPSDPYRRGW